MNLQAYPIPDLENIRLMLDYTIGDIFILKYSTLFGTCVSFHIETMKNYTVTNFSFKRVLANEFELRRSDVQISFVLLEKKDRKPSNECAKRATKASGKFRICASGFIRAVSFLIH